MPSLGADMDEGTLLEWLVKPGDTVHRATSMAVVDTSKAAVEVESFTDGVVESLVVEPGTRVPVGAVLATLAAAGAEAPTLPRPPVTHPPAPHPPAPHPPAPHRRPHPTAEPVVSSPLVRREAERRGVDLADVTGSGRGRRHHPRRRGARGRSAGPARDRGPGRHGRAPGGAGHAVRPQPGPRARGRPGAGVGHRPATGARRRRTGRRGGRGGGTAARPAAPPAAPARKPRKAATKAAAPRATADRREEMRRTIATVMARSKREIPHYYLSLTIDLDRALRWMRERNRDLPVAERLVPAALLLKATALAAAANPGLNGFWVDDAFRPGAGIHLGVAVSLRGGGLVAPAVHDADRLDLDALMTAMRDLVTRARAGRLRRAELSDPTITVTNLGEQGVESVHGVIYPPQVALVGFGRVDERPWAVDGLLGVRPLTVATLAGDHRATDGFTGGRFLAAVDEHLQHPEDL